MDNTVLEGVKNTNDPEKLTEEFLSDEIHDNLRTLALLHPFSNEFNTTFEKVSNLFIISTMPIHSFLKIKIY